MSTGDSNNFLSRLKDLLPGGWFGFVGPVRDAVLGGLSDDLAAVFGLLQAAWATTRIQTTTGWILDLVAWDFFGSRITRLVNESDDPFRARIVAEVLRERVTRKGIVKALTDLTGRAPAIFDPTMPIDTGGYGIPMMGYGKAGAYGSLSLPNQIFITAFRPAQPGIPLLSGYGAGPSGYGVGTIAYADLSQVRSVLPDAVIQDSVDRVVASGVKANLSISG